MTEPLASDLIAELKQALMDGNETILFAKQKQHIDALTTLQQTIAQQQRELLKWEEREARVCPEDVGFQEQMRTLEQELAKYQDDHRMAMVLAHRLEQTCEILRAERDEESKTRIEMQTIKERMQHERDEATAALDAARRYAEQHLIRANEEISKRERAEVAYTLSEQKRLALIDSLDAARAEIARLKAGISDTATDLAFANQMVHDQPQHLSERVNESVTKLAALNARKR